MRNPFIWLEKDNLEKQFCDHCISKFEEDDEKYQGTAGGTYRPDLKKSTDLLISVLDNWKEEDDIFYNSITRAYNKYWDHINLSLPNHNGVVDIMRSDYVKDSGYQIQKTSPSEFYSWHSDASSDNSKARTVTFIWYLNTIDKGGYTEFWDGTKIKPEQGKLLLFPATWDFIHRGVSPKKQTKYICTGWLHYEYVQK
jgi:hypothetical protein